ncbi:MAG: efflux RND transporter permease subunit [Candidatus Omnitrophota bacterium]
MRLADFSVKNSLLVNIISVFVIVFGFFAMLNIKKEAFPSVKFDEMIITTVYPGAPAEDVEKLVTNPIEKEIKGVSGIKEMISRSEENLSTINVVIEPGASDKQKVIDDIRQAVDRVNNLPDEIEEDPQVIELRSDEFPVFELSIGGDVSEETLRAYAEDLEDIILDIDEVSSVTRYGWRDPEFWVEVDPSRTAALHVSMNEVMRALASRNITLPGGLIRMDQYEYNVRTTAEFETAEEIADVIIRANESGNWIRIKDVGSVRAAFEDATSIVRTNSKPTLTMVVIKTGEADIIRLVKRLKGVLEEYKRSLPEGMEITVTNDFSYYVNRRLNVLKGNGIFGLFLVVLVLFIFLDPIPALTTALGIPFALFSTFAIMIFFDISINLVSMLGLIIVLGMLVDDGIIVSENVYRYVEEGMSPKEAAIKGTNEVIAPVTATVVTTMAAFAPLLFMKDIMGKFIKEVPLVVIIALLASLFEAFIMLPSHLSDLMRYQKTRKKKETRKWFVNFQGFYRKILNLCLEYRYIFLAGFVFFAAVVFFIAGKTMKYIGFKDDGIEVFYVKAEAPEGTSLFKSSELAKSLEEVIAALPEDELDAYQTYVGAIQEDQMFDPSAKKASNLVTVTVYLTASQGRERDVTKIAGEIRQNMQDVKGFDKITVDLPQAGPPTGKAVEVGVKGEEFERLNSIAARLQEYLQTIAGVSDVTNTYQSGKKQIRVVVDKERARQLYIDIQDVASAVRYAFDGVVATTVKPKRAEEEIDVVVRFVEDKREDFKTFKEILVENDRGNLVPLSSLAAIEEETGLYSIQHQDGKRVVYVTANVDRQKATSLSVNQLLRKKFGQLSGKENMGYSLDYGGEFEDQMESIGNLAKSFLVAFFVIFIILTATFNSLVQPLIVMLSIPFGLLGVIIAFFFHGEPLSFFSLMGLVGLTGIVVNDSVVLIDFVNKLRLEGHNRRESLITAGTMRLRSVMMTTITTIGGLVSVAYGLGGSDPFIKPMGLAIIWGLAFSTTLTLILIPCVYAVVDDVTIKVLHRSTVKGANETS